MASLVPAAGAPLPHMEDCLLLRATAAILELPMLVAATAATFLHKCRAAQPACELGRQDLVMGVVYAAAKVEEATLSTNHLINVVRMLGALPRHVLQQYLSGSSDAVQQLITAAQGTDVLTGGAYYAAKEHLLVAEQHVLRLVRFQLNTDLPHKYLLNLCKLLSVSRATAAAALCLVHDAVAYTDLCLRQQPVEVAAGALQLCMVVLGDQTDGLGTQRDHAAVYGRVSSVERDESGAERHSGSVRQPMGIGGTDVAASSGQLSMDGRGRRGEACGGARGTDDRGAASTNWVVAVGLSSAAVDAAAEELLVLLDAGILSCDAGALQASEARPMDTST